MWRFYGSNQALLQEIRKESHTYNQRLRIEQNRIQLLRLEKKEGSNIVHGCYHFFMTLPFLLSLSVETSSHKLWIDPTYAQEYALLSAVGGSQPSGWTWIIKAKNFTLSKQVLVCLLVTYSSEQVPFQECIHIAGITAKESFQQDYIGKLGGSDWDEEPIWNFNW